MKNNDLSLNETHRRRNRLIGAVTLLALALIFCISLFFKNRQQVDEADILRRADLEMAAGAAGFCAAYTRANDLYFQAMRLHFQHKELTAKTATARDLARRCLTDQSANIAVRRQVLESGPFTPEDVKELALAHLAAGDRPAALAALARLPDDAYCRWLRDWLRDLPAAEPGATVW